MWGGTPKIGTWLMLDNVYFTNGADNTPILINNHSFENWIQHSAEEPVGWQTSNRELGKYFDTFNSIYKSNDSYIDDYSVLIQSEFAMGDSQNAYISYSNTVNAKPSKMFITYKQENAPEDNGYLELRYYNIISYMDKDTLVLDDRTGDFVTAVVNLDSLNQNVYIEEYTIEIEISSGRLSKIWVDNIDFSYDVKPTNLYAEFDSPTSINTTWDIGFTEKQWQIGWGLADFQDESEAIIKTVSGSPTYKIEGVDNRNSYDIYIRSYRNENEYSDWAGPYKLDTSVKVKNNIKSKFSVYPNPSSGNFKINLNGVYDEIEMSIIDITGECRINKTFTNTNTIELNTQLGKGIYFLILDFNNQKKTTKLIIK